MKEEVHDNILTVNISSFGDEESGDIKESVGAGYHQRCASFLRKIKGGK
jgi:hypothetical protein